MSDFEKKVLEFKNKLDQTQDVKLVESIRSEIFGKNGFINQEFKRIGSLSADEKKNFASLINKAKQELQDIIRSKEKEALTKQLNEKLEKEKILFELQGKLWKNPCSMLTETEEIKKENLNLYGFKGLMLE